jgi:23S rRNA (uracil1939-C5)-methyltransferase
VELNRDAVRDAIWNARRNDVKNIRFVNKDAGEYMNELSQSGENELPDVVILDPPRTGTTQEFIDAAARMAPDRIVYVSCGPDTLARDLKLFGKKGYKALEAQPVDLFPFTEHVETVCCLYHQKKDFVSVPYEPKDAEYLKE